MKYVVVETMPDHHRSSHRAAGNWGVYPRNGAERTIVDENEAQYIIEEDPDEYARVVRPARHYSYCPIDIGFDPRVHPGMAVSLPDDAESVSAEVNGEIQHRAGEREELLRFLALAGFELKS